jgi:hypothetical protein
MRKILLIISLLGLAVFLLSGCTSQAPSTGQTTGHTSRTTPPAQPMTILKPEVAVPRACPITPVFTGSSRGNQGLDFLPWMKAEPTSSGIVAYLFFVRPEFATTHTYGPLHTGGGYPDGRSTKILWYTANPHASNDMQITGKKLSADQAMFQQTFPMASPAGDYPSIVTIPTPGCWELQLQSGTVTAAVTVWVV